MMQHRHERSVRGTACPLLWDCSKEEKNNIHGAVCNAQRQDKWGVFQLKEWFDLDTTRLQAVGSDPSASFDLDFD